MQNDFMSSIKNMLDRVQNNLSETENGAIGYKKTNSALLDLHFQLSSMRNWDDDRIWTAFLKAYNENPGLAVVWLFFARDARGGCGERRVFRVIFPQLANENPKLASKLVELIPFYGRWDDVIDVYCGHIPAEVREEVLKCIKHQLEDDLMAVAKHNRVSLFAKWLPSENTSSDETKRKAVKIRNALGYSPKKYRLMLTMLRRYIDVTEQKMSANQWSDIDYESVPSKAGMVYRCAFQRHDSDRYSNYLTYVKEGKAKMNAGVLFPYEIVHAYMSDSWDEDLKQYDETLELKWKNLPNTVPDNQGTLVVVDGSGSMGARVGHTDITCHDVARSLGIYFAERLSGGFNNSFITFSANPKLIRFDGVESLRSKLQILYDEDDCSNTNIEKTFDLILRTAVENHMRQEDVPANILIVSDMEFDMCTHKYWYDNVPNFDATLFGEIRRRWEAAGYKLPRLVFWNVCSRTGTIPVTENELGVALVSGFSPNIADMVMSGNLDPLGVLIDKLRSDRYADVWKVVMPS